MLKNGNPDIAANVLFIIKKGVYTAHRSELNGKCSKQANLLMKLD